MRGKDLERGHYKVERGMDDRAVRGIVGRNVNRDRGLKGRSESKTGTEGEVRRKETYLATQYKTLTAQAASQQSVKGEHLH